ncbi:MAG: helix-turn-helix domain-containing protein [Syntrophales bacterium]|jgi:excisionase family DNA binding protein|nr:helix-turn-helix domain-containing protein [Syntrophales bacterium]
MKENTADRYLTIQSVAKTLSCTDQYIYGLVREGNLTAIKIGERALRVSEQSLHAFLAARIVNPEDYFAPKEGLREESPRETQNPNIARSNWMNR